MLERPIFIGGMPRSGTTLLRVMLDSHPNIACGPELRVVPALAHFSSQLKSISGPCLFRHYGIDEGTCDKIFGELIVSFLEPYAKKRGRKRIAEKTPANVLHFEELVRLFPDCRCIHVVRDGRDVVASLLGMDWIDAQNGKPMAITRDATIAALGWKTHVSRGRAAAAKGLPVFEIRYERLVTDPEPVLRDLMNFLDEPFTPDMLSFERNPTILYGKEETSASQVSRPLYTQSVGRWRQTLSDAARKAVRNCAGDLLTELGYAHGNDW